MVKIVHVLEIAHLVLKRLLGSKRKHDSSGDSFSFEEIFEDHNSDMRMQA